MEGIRLAKQRLDVPLIGVVGGPWTVFHYLKSHLEEITEASIQFALAQIEAGVDVIQVFDTWADTPEALPPLRRLVEAIAGRVPVIVFTRGLADSVASLPVTAIGVFTGVDLPKLRQKVGPTITLQGNLDPQLLLGDQEQLFTATQQLVRSMKGDPRYIFNLGHGVVPQTPLESVHTLLEAVRTA
jgi:uroporphyrinogen decarboxylase